VLKKVTTPRYLPEMFAQIEPENKLVKYLESRLLKKSSQRLFVGLQISRWSYRDFQMNQL
jgi:hypothetical protein